MITGYSPELGFLRILDISKIIIISTHNSIFLLEIICSNPLSMSECCDSSTILGVIPHKNRPKKGKITPYISEYL